MGNGAITSYIDVAQIALYVFWGFFAALIYYLHREDKREGYPLESDRSAHVSVEGFPAVPSPKTFLLRDGRTVTVPNKARPDEHIGGTPMALHLGSPLEPTGDPMLAGVGPGSWSNRADIVDTTAEGDARLVPLRGAGPFSISRHDPDPRGLPVIAFDDKIAGHVVDLWVDRSEGVFRYLEVQLAAEVGARRVMLPINFTRINSQRVQVRSILAHQFANVPALKSPDLITSLEEDKVMAYYGGGTLYATPQRQEPLL
jgi:photosynthetic reaction center H subunit